ncbi:MAG: DNA double-strand break repair nuclease NurA [Chloroflexi bacterium]|nr:DNA double-strand break repair nuclease NurA [Chloroflexota bacterium]
MPVDFIQLKQQISEMGAHARDYHTRHKSLLEKANEQLQKYAGQGDQLCSLVEQAETTNPRLRCAIPTQPVITQAYDAQPCQQAGLILAADGSQINPSRHDPFPICVINVGAYQWMPGSTPQEIQETRLLYFDDVLTRQGLLTEGMVALRRDLDERKTLARLAEGKPQPVVTLTDGPLELFSESRESEEFRKALREYLESLKQMEKMRVVTAGYVDKPLSDLVVRLLELTLLPEGAFSQSDRVHPLMGVRDEELFATLLKPGQRSAVFSIQSQQTANFTDGLALHFFYLNVGREVKPALARVELPAWVAEDPTMLHLLHSTLVEQCAQMGTNPYPYCLHRAHEIALVSFDEKRKIFDMIAVEHLNQGLSVESPSNKQSNKDLDADRKRYG